MLNPSIESVIEKLEFYLLDEKYKGYDPYDILSSPIFNLPILRTNKLIRFGSQQVFRRIPFNLRPLLGIKKEVNPVTLGLVIQAFTYLSQVYAEKKEFYQEQIDYCLNKLVELKSKEYSGTCWGYNFDWEARYAKINKYVPTVVATGIIVNGIYEYYQFFPSEKVKDILISSANFVLRDLQRTYDGENFCFSYSPYDNQVVYNATMKGARLLAQVYSITKDKYLIEEAEKAVRFVCNNQNENGSWAYSKGDARKWVDNFHTAYVLDSLKVFIGFSGKKEYAGYLKKGLDYYLDNLFTKEDLPKYYSNSFFPIDATATAQSIISLTNFGFIKKAEKVIEFAIDNLYDSRGYFYYQKKLFNDKTPFIRWSIGWFFVALSFYLLKSQSERNNDLG